MTNTLVPTPTTGGPLDDARTQLRDARLLAEAGTTCPCAPRRPASPSNASPKPTS